MKTAWYPGTKKPVRIGLYERLVLPQKFVIRSKWNGKKWMGTHFVILEGEACRLTLVKSPDQHLPWRGLTERKGER